MEVYITEIENQATTAKSTELKNWEKQKVYVEEFKDDIDQLCISIRWVLIRKVNDGQGMTKARLWARGFEEQKDFPTDFQWYSRIGARSIFALIASNRWEIKAIDIKTAFPQGK